MSGARHATMPRYRAAAVAVLVALLGGCAATPPPSGTGPVGSQPVASRPGPAASSSSSPTVASSSPESTNAGPTRTPAPTAGPAIPAFHHVYLIVMENHESSAIVGNGRAPFINGLIARFGLATEYTAVAHPSEPNYLALFGGSTFGVRDDGTYDLAGTNLADQLEAHGRTWHVYAQDLPGRCSRVGSASGPVDLVGAGGTYARKHEPAISFTDISSDPVRCARITDLGAFDPEMADFELIVPNQANDMHDGTIEQGDAFLAAFVPRITERPAFAGSLLVITWDEGSTDAGGGGRVATIVVAATVPRAFRSAVPHTHYSLLRTIEEAWGLGCLRESCAANDLREFFGR